jgi:hypothetical protein
MPAAHSIGHEDIAVGGRAVEKQRLRAIRI